MSAVVQWYASGVVWNMNMVASPIFVFDSSPLVASCQCSVGGVSVAALVIAGTQVWIPQQCMTKSSPEVGVGLMH
jgi:hypothetical protein